MNFSMAQRILGIMLMIFSLTMLPPIAVSFLYADGHWQPFLASAAIIASAGLLLWLPARSSRRELRLRDGFLIVSVFWVFLGLAGATPLYLSDVPDLSFTDSVFEAVSGFTTTGATVIVGLDDLPKSILYYRQQIQWFGGMGIIVLAVAILPILGIGGMSLYKAETPGPMKDQKLTPRITQTAKALWAIYLALTIACVTAYWLAGMNLFDAVAHAFSTVSTAGFSPYDTSLAHFDSIGVEARRNGLHVPRRRELRAALHRAEAPRHRQLLARHRVQGLLPADRGRDGVRLPLPVRHERVPDVRRVPAPCRLPGGLDADHDGTADGGLRALAGRASRAPRAALVRRRLRRVDHRRHEGDPLADRVPPGHRRAQAAGAPERRGAGEARRPRQCRSGSSSASAATSRCT